MNLHGTSIKLLATGAACLAFATAFAACGDSGDDGTTDGASNETATTQVPTGPGPIGKESSEQKAARATLERLYAGHRAHDAEAVCEELSAALKKQVSEGALGQGGATCEESWDRHYAQGEKSGEPDRTGSAQVGKITIEGDHGTARVNFGAQGAPIPLVKIDGEWKLDAVGTGR